MFLFTSCMDWYKAFWEQVRSEEMRSSRSCPRSAYFLKDQWGCHRKEEISPQECREIPWYWQERLKSDEKSRGLDAGSPKVGRVKFPQPYYHHSSCSCSDLTTAQHFHSRIILLYLFCLTRQSKFFDSALHKYFMRRSFLYC